MRVIVDKARCQGHAVCVICAPNSFELDDDGYNQMAPFEVRPEEEDHVRRAAMMCPERAILLEDASGNPIE